ncbi:40S ribosomal protein S7 [Harpegnathos saltator]|nr:40S ribosomal protein S7 [Harpegnathos saltator]
MRCVLCVMQKLVLWPYHLKLLVAIFVYIFTVALYHLYNLLFRGSYFFSTCLWLFEMFTANAKIIKSGGAEPDQFELGISNALLDLEMNSDLKSQLRELYITKAREMETNNKKSIIIYVPMPKLKAFQKIQTRLVRELEKKFSGKHVMFVGERKILPKPTRKTRTKNKQKRPRSRTLTAVYDALLEDLVYPVEIVGKRTRVKLDGSQVIKVHLDRNEQTNIEHKVDTFASVYKQLTGRDVTFEFPESYV